MSKSPEAYENAAKFFKDRADKHWAAAKNGGDGRHYNDAKRNYDSASRASAAAKAARNK